jgi:hypothetical protein
MIDPVAIGGTQARHAAPLILIDLIANVIAVISPITTNAILPPESVVAPSAAWPTAPLSTQTRMTPSNA